jgi:hypothetical protein
MKKKLDISFKLFYLTFRAVKITLEFIFCKLMSLFQGLVGTDLKVVLFQFGIFYFYFS